MIRGETVYFKRINFPFDHRTGSLVCGVGLTAVGETAKEGGSGKASRAFGRVGAGGGRGKWRKFLVVSVRDGLLLLPV